MVATMYEPGSRQLFSQIFVLCLVAFVGSAAFAEDPPPNPPLFCSGDCSQQLPEDSPTRAVTMGHWVVKACRELNNRPCDISAEVLNSSAVGIVLQLEWRDLEQNGDNGWTFENLDSTFSVLKQHGKKMAIQFFFTAFGNYQGCLDGSLSACYPMTPSFMWDDCATYGGDKSRYPNVQCSSYIGDVNGDIYIHKHNPNVRRQMGELFTKINSQYGDDADFEALFIPESTQRGGLPDDGWTRASHVDAIIDIAAKAREALPTKAVYYMTNFLPAEDRFNGDATAFMEYLINQFDVWISWPDTPTCRTEHLISNQRFVFEKYRGSKKVFIQQQGGNYSDKRTACLDGTPWIRDMYEYIATNVAPGSIGWHSEFYASSNTRFADLERDVLSNSDAPMPVQ